MRLVGKIVHNHNKEKTTELLLKKNKRAQRDLFNSSRHRADLGILLFFFWCVVLRRPGGRAPPVVPRQDGLTALLVERDRQPHVPRICQISLVPPIPDVDESITDTALVISHRQDVRGLRVEGGIRALPPAGIAQLRPRSQDRRR